MKTLLIGNFGAGNIGDELILSAALEKYPDSVVMTSDSQFSQFFTEKEFKTISMPATGVRSILKSFFSVSEVPEGIEQIVFPGGGLFAITPKAYFIWGQVIDWCVKCFPQVPIVFEHQGVDQPRNALEERLLRKALSETSKVTVRDKESAQVVQKYSIKKAEIVGDRVETYLVTAQISTPSKTNSQLLLLNAMKSYDKETLQQKFPDHNIQEIAFGKGDLGQIPQTKTELFELLGKADVMVGERFHSLILGNHFCKGKTYLLREAYSDKVRALQERFEINKV